jgi:hypothetical protein
MRFVVLDLLADQFRDFVCLDLCHRISSSPLALSSQLVDTCSAASLHDALRWPRFHSELQSLGFELKANS